MGGVSSSSTETQVFQQLAASQISKTYNDIQNLVENSTKNDQVLSQSVNLTVNGPGSSVKNLNIDFSQEQSNVQSLISVIGQALQTQETNEAQQDLATKIADVIKTNAGALGAAITKDKNIINQDICINQVNEVSNFLQNKLKNDLESFQHVEQTATLLVTNGGSLENADIKFTGLQKSATTSNTTGDQGALTSLANALKGAMGTDVTKTTETTAEGIDIKGIMSSWSFIIIAVIAAIVLILWLLLS